MLAAASPARADNLDRLLADNPPLALLARRVDQVKVELSSCNWFGDNNTAECKRRMDAHEITRILDGVRKPDHARVYCVSYNHPIVADRSFQPISGFHCWMKSEFSTATLELSCEDAPRACSLHYRASNDDEDTDYDFTFRLVGRGRTLAIEDDKVSFSFAHTN